MTAALSFAPTADFTEFRLMIDGRATPVDSWAIAAPSSLLPAVDLLNRLVTEDRALQEGDAIFVEHAAIADLSAAEAAVLHLPGVSDAVARVETQGLVSNPAFRATLQWLRPTGQPYVRPERVGAWLKAGERTGRLSTALFAIAEAVDVVATAGDDPAARLLAVGRLTELLPSAAAEGKATAGGLVGRVEIVQADAFSLDLVGNGAATRLVPILHRAGETEPLLSAEQQSAFGDDQFNRFVEARPVYTLPGGRFVVLTPTLRRALNEVRRCQSSTATVRRAMMAAPRAVLRSALESDDDPTLVERLETLFVETPAYSDRVTGLGIWTPRVVPWIQRVGTDWFGPSMPDLRAGGDAPGGLVVGDRRLDLAPEEAERLRQQVENAIGRGEPTTIWQPSGEAPVVIPANEETRDALTELANQRAAARGEKGGQAPERRQVEALLIFTNEDEVEYNQNFALRTGNTVSLPHSLKTAPKTHQVQGIEWLQSCWLAGRPGVLLADDMGLGKTLQGLAFLAWLRESMSAGRIEQAPILIVAPTGLLANWRAEHDRHLKGEGLGTCLAAYGNGLRELLGASDDGMPTLDQARLRAADWVLTTYETLRDYDRDFGAVKFAVLLADEAQKVKTPGARVTDSLKGMNADFRVAMTGTPVENRLADLWCIVDGIHSGWLGDLKGFSRLYEAEADIERLRGLKSLLDQPVGGAPKLLMRRLKEDELPDLPTAEAHVVEVPMPERQSSAYDDILAEVRGTDRKGAVLEALQKLRLVALHPEPQMSASDEEFIASSARLKVCFDALDEVSRRGDRALIFLDSIDMQSRLAGLIQRRYGLPAPPAIINGEVAGHRRQQRVDRFQASPDGFDVMILSPRAGGVGLTLTRANHVVHLARWWNPAVEDQCTGRALRIGQTRTVHVHIPIGVLPDGRRSFDQNLHDLLERKRRLMRDALLPGGFSADDQRALLDATTGASQTA